MRDLAGLDVAFLAGTLGAGGSERQLFYMVRALRRGGARVRVVSLTRGEFWMPRIEALDVPVIPIAGRSKAGRALAIAAALRRQPPHVIQSQHFFVNLYAVVAGRLVGAPVIGALRNDATSEVRPMGRWLGLAGLRAPRLVAANSRTAIRTAIRLGAPRGRLLLLKNVVDTDHFAPRDRERGTRGPVTILSIGRLVAQKRMDRLVAAAGAASRSLSTPVRLVIVGEGGDEYRRALVRRAKIAGLSEDAFELRPAIADPSSLYREADIFALTSDWEGTPNVILEAMASGLPVVATDVGGVAELVSHGRTGYLADRFDESALARHLRALVADEGLRRMMGAAGRSAIVHQRALDRLPEQLVELYSAALSPRARPVPLPSARPVS